MKEWLPINGGFYVDDNSCSAGNGGVHSCLLYKPNIILVSHDFIRQLRAH